MKILNNRDISSVYKFSLFHVGELYPIIHAGGFSAGKGILTSKIMAAQMKKVSIPIANQISFALSETAYSGKFKIVGNYARFCLP